MITDLGRATHLVGGEIYYDCLGSNQYRITLIVYRDCGPTNTNNTQFDSQAAITVFENNSLYSNHATPYSTINLVPVDISDPCLVSPPNTCIEEAIYRQTVTLPPSAAGYTIAYQRCCRNPSTQNVFNPGDQGSTYVAVIPTNDIDCNSSPRFTNYPPAVVCADNDFYFDHSALDPDGDSLSYELCTPYHGASATAPVSNPAAAPPYNTIPWAAGYGVNNQIQGSPTISVDPLTGVLTGVPNLTGIFTFGICVKEWRNGVQLGESRRDFQMYVVSCQPVLIASVPDQTDSCENLTVTFMNNSVGSSFYEWDFGDGNTSSAISPTHTYQNPGTYTVTLIANPGWACGDTTEVEYTVYEPLVFSFPSVDPECILTNSFDFQASGNYSNVATLEWDFGALANPQTSNLENPSNVVYSDSGNHVISLTVNDGGCVETIYDTVVVFPEVEIDFFQPDELGCLPYTVTFQDSSFSWTDMEYLWDFGDGNTSTQPSPTHTYLDTGLYTVSLTISTDSGCIADLTLVKPDVIEVFPAPTAGINVSPEETDIYRPYFWVDNFFSSDVTDWYLLDMHGDTLNTEAERYYTTDTGWVVTYQHVYNQFGCSDIEPDSIYVRPITTLFVPNAFTPDGDGVNDFWSPVVRDAKEYELYVYDRWGQLFFHTTNPQDQWDGTMKGKRAPVDVYVYQVYFRPQEGPEERKTGHFTLVR